MSHADEIAILNWYFNFKNYILTVFILTENITKGRQTENKNGQSNSKRLFGEVGQIEFFEDSNQMSANSDQGDMFRCDIKQDSVNSIHIAIKRMSGSVLTQFEESGINNYLS